MRLAIYLGALWTRLHGPGMPLLISPSQQPCSQVQTIEPHGAIMMTSSNGNIFHVTGPLCGEITGHRWIPHIKASDAELWGFFDLRLNKRFSKQSWDWWFETSSRSLWRHCNNVSTSRQTHWTSGRLLNTKMIKQLTFSQNVFLGCKITDH